MARPRVELQIEEEDLQPQKPAHSSNWRPNLNPTQQLAFDDNANAILVFGEKGTGKTIVCLHALVRHCYENKNALALIIAGTIFTGSEGALYDLTTFVLPTWRDGNRYPEYEKGVRHPKAGELMDSGMGLQYTEPKMDPATKDRVLYIINRHGKRSKVILKSIPHAKVVEARIKGPAPSFIFGEEVTDMSSREYFTKPMAQLGRRRGVKGPQQYYMACNPKGPSNWVYQLFWEEAIDEATGLRKPSFSVYHVPIIENVHRLEAGYVQRLMDTISNPIDRDRLIYGKWVEMPSGDAIFKNYWLPEIHIKGDVLKGTWEWKPLRQFPVIVGIDPGPANFSITFLQHIITKEKSIWVVFDEINCVGEHKTVRQATTLMLARMDHWDTECARKNTFVFISDEAAFNQQNSDGSYDATEIQKHGKGRIHLRGCPKGKGSIRERVEMVISDLLGETLYISARCLKTIDMMRMLSSAKQKPGLYDETLAYQPVKSIYTHPFSSMTYPMFYFALQPGRFAMSGGDEIKPMVYACGEGR